MRYLLDINNLLFTLRPLQSLWGSPSDRGTLDVNNKHIVPHDKTCHSCFTIFFALTKYINYILYSIAFTAQLICSSTTKLVIIFTRILTAVSKFALFAISGLVLNPACTCMYVKLYNV